MKKGDILEYSSFGTRCIIHVIDDLAVKFLHSDVIYYNFVYGLCLLIQRVMLFWIGYEINTQLVRELFPYNTTYLLSNEIAGKKYWISLC